MSELLLCPFCGGEANTWDGVYMWYVVCKECGATGSPWVNQAEAIAAWNTRAERTCKMESVWGTNALQCSECCSYVSTWDAECEIGKINYCPNCGSRVVE